MITLIGCRGCSRRLLPALGLHLPPHPKCHHVSAPTPAWLRTEKWLEKGKRQRMGESMSLELVTDIHCHHSALQSSALKVNHRLLLEGSNAGRSVALAAMTWGHAPWPETCFYCRISDEGAGEGPAPRTEPAGPLSLSSGWCSSCLEQGQSLLVNYSSDKFSLLL